MQLLTALLAATAAALATTAVATSQLDAEAAPPPPLPGARPSNDSGGGTSNSYAGNPGGKPSAAEHRAAKAARMAERRARVQAAIQNAPHDPASTLQRMDAESLARAVADSEARAAKRKGEGGQKEGEAAQLRGIKEGLERERRRGRGEAGGEVPGEAREDLERKLWGNGGGGDPYEAAGGLAPETNYYDKWQQAYRFLGGFVDCDHGWSDGSHDSGDNQDRDNGACSRWMMWAAYIDPNYAGGGYDEYFGDDAPGALDCHSPDTSWTLVGVYRQEFYQYIEQISKHLWAIDEYEYIVALAGLEYMTDNECFGVGYDESGAQLYAEVQPLAGGTFQMGLYSDAQCLQLNTETSYTYDDYAAGSELDLGSKDQTDDDAFRSQAYEYWQETQEYTLGNLNAVYRDFQFCTSCVDYPTYQDGYFIGDDGTDDDDLINQCWKFYSHDSFNCDADCLAMGSEQGTIAWVAYGGRQFGQLVDGQYDSDHEGGSVFGDNGQVSSTASSASDGAHRLDRLKANLFVTCAGVVFVATFLAFAVARGSSKKKKSRSRSRRLLDDDRGDRGDGRRRASGRSSGRSASRARRSSQSVGRERSSRSKSKGRSASKSVKSSRSARSKSRARRSEAEYEPPRSEERKRRSQSRSGRSARSKSRSRAAV